MLLAQISKSRPFRYKAIRGFYPPRHSRPLFICRYCSWQYMSKELEIFTDRSWWTQAIISLMETDSKSRQFNHSNGLLMSNHNDTQWKRGEVRLISRSITFNIPMGIKTSLDAVTLIGSLASRRLFLHNNNKALFTQGHSWTINFHPWWLVFL